MKEQNQLQANELRIGNLVNETVADGGVKYRQTQVDGNRIKCIESGDTVRGIPISDELLLSFGFLFNEKSKSYRVFSQNVWILSAQQTHDKTGYKIGLPIDGRQDQYMTFFTDIHQLQNLYFAIVGQELLIENKELVNNTTSVLVRLVLPITSLNINTSKRHCMILKQTP